MTAVPDGGVGFHWKIDHRDLEIEFLPDGTVEFLKTTANGNRSIEEGAITSCEDWKALWNWLVGV
jgi:hypothetical protein